MRRSSKHDSRECDGHEEKLVEQLHLDVELPLLIAVVCRSDDLSAVAEVVVLG